MAQFRKEKLKKLGKLILQLTLMLFAIAYSWYGTVYMLRMAYALLSLSKYASLYFLAAFIAIVSLPGFALARTRGAEKAYKS